MCTALNFPRGGEVNLFLAPPSEVKKIHGRFFNKKSDTDVMTFADGTTVEIIVSIAQARKQALPRGLTLDQEVTLLAGHGLLHAKGHDDRREKDALLMRQKEFELMARVF